MASKKKVLWLLALLPYGVLAFHGASNSAKHAVSFQTALMPIVRAHCLSCHGSDVKSGGLDLSSEKGWKAGGTHGPLFRAGKPAASLLVARLAGADGHPRMPLGFPALKPAESHLFTDWIAQGAKYESITFDGNVAVLLKARCASCHSGAQPRAGLDVTDYKSLLRVVKPGSPQASVLMQRLTGSDGQPQMPLGFTAMDPKQTKIIADWIRDGALEGDGPARHWAYVPVVKPSVPELNSAWVKNPIDAFVLADLRANGLHPNRRAPASALLRRASLALTGLPPTETEINRFASGIETYPQALDRLLASPHYGEHMARSWLDLARYADSNGYEKDNHRSAWPYRDWVINAFNKNLPYDQFTVQQLAGDLLPNPTTDELVATGFNRNTMINLEDGVDQDEAMFEIRNDRVSTTAVVWLGQTLGCARCHDHKYDPLSQHDYYRFSAFFGNNAYTRHQGSMITDPKFVEPTLPLLDAAQSKVVAAKDAQISLAQTAFDSKKQAVLAEQRAWEAEWAAKPFTALSVATVTPGLEVSGSEVRATGPNPETATYDINVNLATNTRALELDALADANLPAGGPGRSMAGDFVLSGFIVDGAKVVRAAADYTQEGYDPAGVFDGNPDTGWAIGGAQGKSHRLVLELDHPLSGKVHIQLQFLSKQLPGNTLGRFALLGTTHPNATRFAFPASVLTALAEAGNSPEAQTTVSEYFAQIATANAGERDALNRLEYDRSVYLRTVPSALVMRDGPGKPRARFRYRGAFLTPKEWVDSATPPALGPVAHGTRLALARWIINRKNPLTARVEVNRLWENVFGHGLVETSENFGTQGSKPSHPQLLDWLAATYMEMNWDTKRMLRLILSSNTYQQSSAGTLAAYKRDPLNALLARGPRYRLSAESIRDVALASAGLLNPKMGGPPVYPYQPKGVWDSPYSGEEWGKLTPEDAYRRSIYTFWKRTAPYPLFIAFDATSRESCTVRRIRTNSPLQALATLNDPGLFDAAKALGERFRKAKGPVSAQIAEAFRVVTARSPSSKELSRLEMLYQKMCAKGDATYAWTLVGNVILNLDEAITNE